MHLKYFADHCVPNSVINPIQLIDFFSAHPDGSHYRGRLFLVEAHRIRVRE
jgi:hypothetical protein